MKDSTTFVIVVAIPPAIFKERTWQLLVGIGPPTKPQNEKSHAALASDVTIS